MNKCNLHTVLRLPTGIFYAQGVKTNVLFFTRGKTDENNTKEVWFYDLRTNMQSFGKTNQLKKEHFAGFKKPTNQKTEGQSKMNAGTVLPATRLLPKETALTWALSATKVF